MKTSHFFSFLKQAHVHPEEGEWMALIDRELPPDDAQRLHRHLTECPQCERTYASLRAASAAAGSLVKPVPSALLDHTRAGILQALPERLSMLPSEVAIRNCLGSQLSVRLRTSPEQVRAAIHTMLGSPHSVQTFRLMPQFIWFASGLCFLLTVCAWIHWMAFGGWGANGPGDFTYMGIAFGAPHKIFLILTAAAATALSFGALCQFEQRHPLYSAWLMLFVAAGCRLVGRAVGELPSVISAGHLESFRSAGQLIAGPISQLSLGFGLLVALRAYRSVGLSLRLTVMDCVMLSAGTIFTLRHLTQILAILRHGPVQEPIALLNWLSDPALLFTLAVSVPLRRIALSQGGGLVASCWSAMTAGALLTFLGNFMIFLENYSYLPWPWYSVTWIIWIPASAAFTLGPAYQFAANGALVPRPVLAPESR